MVCVVLTRLATEPLMEAIMAMLPPLPQRIISFATAWAVMKTPVNLRLAKLLSCLRSTYLKWTELTSNVDLEHHVRICLRIIEGRSFLLNAGCGDEAVQPALRFTNALDHCVQALHVSNIDLAVVKSVACTMYKLLLRIWLQQTKTYQAPQQLSAAL